MRFGKLRTGPHNVCFCHGRYPVLHTLVNRGNTVLVIEHDLNVIKTADWIVDLGSEGGSGGGRIVAEGTSEDMAKVRASHTGHYLQKVL